MPCLANQIVEKFKSAAPYVSTKDVKVGLVEGLESPSVGPMKQYVIVRKNDSLPPQLVENPFTRAAW